MDEFFCWLRYQWVTAWELGKEISIDKQTCMFHGRSEYKVCSGWHKRLGDGLQEDALADDGYTWAFHFQNKPVDKK